MKGQSLWDRVWTKVCFPAEAALTVECWVWVGAFSHKRRGQRRPVVQVGGRGSKIMIVARVVCEWYHGDPPTPYHEAGHTCPTGENSACVSPHHLRWMTRSENEKHKAAELLRRLADGEPVDTDPPSALESL